MILSREVSRLSRTDKDWARLMEVCQLFGTLIADAEQIYDLNLIDDQLVLGIKHAERSGALDAETAVAGRDGREGTSR